MNTPKDKSDTKTARTKNNRLPDRTAVLIPAYEPETAMLILLTLLWLLYYLAFLQRWQVW